MRKGRSTERHEPTSPSCAYFEDSREGETTIKYERAGVDVRLTDTLSWNSSVGSYYQQPAFLFVSAFPLNSALVPWRADHYVTTRRCRM